MPGPAGSQVVTIDLSEAVKFARAAPPLGLFSEAFRTFKLLRPPAWRLAGGSAE